MPPRRVLLGVSLVCAANLLLEISLTRIFSALMFYHFTFFAIALALLGMGAAGVYVFVRAERFTAETTERDLARFARWFGFASVVALAYVLANPAVVYVELGDSPRLDNINFLQLAFLAVVAATPFFFAGLVVSIAVTHYRDAIDRVYAFDLAGAGLAALAVGVAIRLLGGPGLIAACCVLACGASVLFARSRRAWIAFGASAAVLGLALFTTVFAPPGTKTVQARRVIYDGWNTFSRITVEKVGKEAHDIRIDSAARAGIAHLRDATSQAWRTEISSLAYHVHEGGAEDVLIIGPGGGIDVTRALASGAKHLTGVEINPLIADEIMRGDFAELSGNLYRDPRVTIEVDEGRSFIRRTENKYDVIQASLIDTWAATASGAFALTENTLYTVEAFEDYYAHLTDRGVLTMTRWWTFASNHETVRLVILAAAALEQRGVAPAKTLDHLFLAKKGMLATLLVKPAGFSAAETRALTQVCAQAGFDVVLSSQSSREQALAAMVSAGAWSDAVRAYPQHVVPPTDDRPFFFYFVKPSDLWTFHGRLADPALWLLVATAGLLTLLTIVFIFVPLAMRWADVRRAEGGKRRALGLGYFAAIGLAFMVVEIALMQRLSLFLGHPSYALVVVLFAILVGTAGGAAVSRRFTSPRTVAIAGGIVAVLAIAAGFVLDDLVRAWITWPLALRMIASAVIVLAFGAVMGVMLPLGATLVAKRDAPIIPWAWGINGGMSVIGTVGATVIAINAGFTATFLTGAVLYLVAGALGFTLARAVESKQSAASSS